MSGRKVDKGLFEAQFHNHHHYEDSEDPRDAIPEWYELPKAQAQPFRKGGVVGEALKLVDKKR